MPFPYEVGPLTHLLLINIEPHLIKFFFKFLLVAVMFMAQLWQKIQMHLIQEKLLKILLKHLAGSSSWTLYFVMRIDFLVLNLGGVGIKLTSCFQIK